MIIDGHVHLLPERVRKNRAHYCNMDPAFCALYKSEKSRLASEDEIIGYLDRCGIRKAVVFGFPWQDPDLVRINNDEVREFHDRFPERIIPFATLSSRGGDPACREAERTLAAGFAGLGELAVYEGGWAWKQLNSLGPALAMAGDAGVPVMLHVNEPVGHEYPGKITIDFPALLHLIEAYPAVDFILAHFGGGLFVYGLMPEIGRLLERTYLDTAAAPFLYDPRVYEVAARILGPEKLIFGSDYPLLSLPRYLKDLDAAALDDGLRQAILGRNLERLLGSS